MQFCHRCGERIDEEVVHCPFCGVLLDGTLVLDSEDIATPEEMDVNPPLTESTNGKIAAKTEAQISRKKIAIIAGLLGGVVALVTIVSAIIMLLMPPNLSEDKILSDFDSVSVDTSTFTNSLWSSNEGYEETFRELQGIEECNRESRKATVVRIYENTSFKVTCVFEASYVLENDEWQPHELFESSRSFEPIAGVNDEAVLSQASSIVSSIEETSHNDEKEYKTTLESIYGNAPECSIVENNTTAEGGSVVLQMSTIDGFTKYQGNITVHFLWNGSDWEIGSCTVDDQAYKADLSYFVGTWVGTFEGSNLDYYVLSSDSNCLGGNVVPLTLTIKSIDQETMSATADISFCLHNHGGVENQQDSDTNDKTIRLTDVLIPIECEDDAYFTLVTQDDQPFYRVSLDINDGTLEGHVRSGTRAGSTRTDDYIMVKQ